MQIISTCRPGARIAGSGRISRHASGNAIDFSAGGRKGAVVRWLIANHKSGGTMTYSRHEPHPRRYRPRTSCRSTAQRRWRLQRGHASLSLVLTGRGRLLTARPTSHNPRARYVTLTLSVTRRLHMRKPSSVMRVQH